MSDIRPNFFLIGPPKCGTTAAAFKLNQHPEIYMSDPKEPNYFVYQGGNPYGWQAEGKDSFERYKGIFKSAGNAKIVGEASPYYLCCHHVAGEIFKFNPNAKIIAILRNPVFRALSTYRFWYSATGHDTTIDDFIASFKGEKLVRHFERSQRYRVGWLKDIGLYHKHLERYWRTFPANQVKLLFYDDFKRDYRKAYREAFAFLGISDVSQQLATNDVVNKTFEPRFRWLNGVINADRSENLASYVHQLPFAGALRSVRAKINRLNERPGNPLLQELDARTYGELIDVYLDDIAKLEAATGRDLAGWRDGTME